MYLARDQHTAGSFVISITGHRDIHPDDLNFVREQVFQLMALIAAALPNTPIQCWTALADGADQLFAEQVLRVQKQCVNPTLNGAERIQLVIPLPMPLESYCSEQVGGEAGSRPSELSFQAARAAFASRVATYTSVAAQVFVVPECQLDNDPVEGITQENAPYIRLAHLLTQRSDIVIAIWDGQTHPDHLFPRLPGGTRDLVQHLLTSTADKDFHVAAVHLMQQRLSNVIHVYTRRSAPSSAGLPTANQNGVGFAVVAIPRNHAENQAEIRHVLTPNGLVQLPTLAQWLTQPRQAIRMFNTHRTWSKVVTNTEHLLGYPLDEPSRVVLYRICASAPWL